MARMLGRFTSGGCWSGGRSHGRPCIPPGPDCAGWVQDTRRRKRAEARGVARLIRESDREDPPDWADREAIAGECRHGCNGDDIVNGHASEECDFLCHPGLSVDPERAERFEAILGRLEGL